MGRANQIFRKARKALHDLDLLKILQSEIAHELSSTRFLVLFSFLHWNPFQSISSSSLIFHFSFSHSQSQNHEHNNGSSSDFAVEYDSPMSRDVVLRRKLESGEEVAISALPGRFRFGHEGAFPREILMKICVSKPGVSSLLQFDCGVSEDGHSGSPFKIYNAYYLQSSACLGPSVYRGPLFRYCFLATLIVPRINIEHSHLCLITFLRS